MTREQRYRLRANRGTFLAHRTLGAGRPAKELIPAIRDIKAAIRLKPNAHFGREGIQLRVLQWIVARTADAKIPNLGLFLSTDDPNNAKLATGLAGLIELGNAWESPDVVGAIGALAPEADAARSREGHGGRGIEAYQRAGTYARLRYAELLANGRRPIDSEAGMAFHGPEAPEPERSRMGAAWHVERAAAERRTALRAEYVEARVARGRHPDTDPGFWSEWREPVASTAPTRLPDRIKPGVDLEARNADVARLLYVSSAGLLITLAALVYGVRRLLRWRAREKAARSALA